MDEQELRQLLDLLVIRGTITTEEAEDFLERYLAGQVSIDDLPLPGDEADEAGVGDRVYPEPSNAQELSDLRDFVEREIQLLVASNPPTSELHAELISIITAYNIATGASIEGDSFDYLYLFMGSVALGLYSLAQIAARANSYLGDGWGAFFRGEEANLSPNFWVVDYIARDDPITCTPCIQAQLGGPYLPGEGPFPGEVCFGRGACRCIRTPRRV